MKRPLLKKPLGPSKLGHGFGTDWNNQSMGTTGAVVCEICGTKHPEINDSEPTRTISRFLDHQVVEECCGAIIDYVYRELGEAFVIAFFEEFAEDPGNIRFFTFRSALQDAVKEAAKKLAEVSTEVAEISEATKVINL
jgi:hypothetical protein